jgi:hypothetical protein
VLTALFQELEGAVWGLKAVMSSDKGRFVSERNLFEINLLPRICEAVKSQVQELPTLQRTYQQFMELNSTASQHPRPRLEIITS